MRCPDCGTDVIEELDYCFGCFRHLAARPSEKEKLDDGFLPDDELVDATPQQSFMTWAPGSIPKGTLTFGTAIVDSEWHRARRDDH